MRKPEPAERVTRRVRAFRKRRREALKQQNTFVFALREYLRNRGLSTEWVSAKDVYDETEVLKVFITFDQYLAAIKGSRKNPGVKSIETTTAWIDSSSTILIRPVRIPRKRIMS